MKSKWEYFSKEELSCTGNCAHCSGSDELMNNEVMQDLVKLRKLCGFPLPITSAYRCPARNSEVSGTGKTGPHTTGRAVDIHVYGPKALVVIGMALKLGFTGIGVNQKGPINKRFIHLDKGLPDKRPNIWSY